MTRRRGAQPGSQNNNWKGGRTVASNGYVLVRVGVEHPLADVRGYAYEHRLVAEQKLGRSLRDDEEVHHRDEDKQNNHPDNLEVVTRPEHRREHRRHDKGLRVRVRLWTGVSPLRPGRATARVRVWTQPENLARRRARH